MIEAGYPVGSVQGTEANFAEILIEHVGKQVYVFTNFLGKNTPKIPLNGTLNFVGPDAIILYSESDFWVLLYREDIAYVIFPQMSTSWDEAKNVSSKVSQQVSNVYASDILSENLGKKVDVFLNFMGNEPNERMFEGLLAATGVDFLIVDVATMGGPLMLGWMNLASVIFREKPKIPDEHMSSLSHELITTTYADIAKENLGHQIVAWTYFVGNSPPAQRIIGGALVVVGENAIIIEDEQLGGPTMVYFSNVAYAVFNKGFTLPKELLVLPFYQHLHSNEKFDGGTRYATPKPTSAIL